MSTRDLDREFLTRKAENEINYILGRVQTTGGSMRSKDGSEAVYLTNDKKNLGRIVIHIGATQVQNVSAKDIDQYISIR